MASGAANSRSLPFIKEKYQEEACVRSERTPCVPEAISAKPAAPCGEVVPMLTVPSDPPPTASERVVFHLQAIADA
jgi:hypothetical protein